MLLRRDYFFDGLATATGVVTTPREVFYGYWQCYYAQGSSFRRFSYLPVEFTPKIELGIV